LNSNCYLFLGSAETVEASPELFEPIDRETRIYRSKAGPKRPLPSLQHPLKVPRFAHYEAPRHSQNHREGLDRQHIAALEQYAPPSILVDESHTVQHLSPSAGRFIMPSVGPLSSLATMLVRPELRVDLKLGLERALAHNEPTLSLPASVRFDGERRRVALHIVPTGGGDGAQRRVLVFFLDGGTMPEALPGADDASDDRADDTRQLREELSIAQERLSVSRTEHELSIQELRAANEELQSINEEYRSTSEELETSKEELQSMNEELQTVNAELKNKLAAISTAHDDLQNLMAATEVGTLFLDSELHIKLFTPEVARHFNITEADVGRSIADFTHRLVYDRVEKDALNVLKNLVPVETEVETKNGRWLMMRVRPYRTTEDRIEGVVVTFVDVTTRREAESQLRESEARYKSLFKSISEGFLLAELVSDDDGHVVDLCYADANPSAEKILAAKLKGALCSNATGHLPPEWLETAVRVAQTGESESHEIHLKERDQWLEVHLSPVANGDGKHRVAMLLQDVTDRKNWETSQQVLIGELNHRVKNMLTVVHFIARQTQAKSASREEFNEAFESRLIALAAAYDILTARQWTGADLRTLITKTLRPLVGESFAHVRFEGSDLALTSNAALPISLALHELGTNALKYGSLSVPDGNVLISWSLLQQEDNPGHHLLRLAWREVDGPPVKPAAEAGFGMKLLEEAVAWELGGTTELKLNDHGLTWCCEFPYDRPTSKGMKRDGENPHS